MKLVLERGWNIQNKKAKNKNYEQTAGVAPVSPSGSVQVVPERQVPTTPPSKLCHESALALKHKL